MSGEPIDQREIEHEIGSCIASQHAIREHLLGIEGIDPTGPSRLPDWTIGHVLTHIARNADSIVSMMNGRPQYPHGRDGRNADIDAGATRTWSELVDDVGASARAAEHAVVTCSDWSGEVEMITGQRAKRQVPLLRQREVEVHRVDLGLGYEFTEMPSDYVRRDLRLMGMLWTARKPMGMTPIPDEALAADPATRLAWMMGRTDIPGLDPAALL